MLALSTGEAGGVVVGPPPPQAASEVRVAMAIREAKMWGKRWRACCRLALVLVPVGALIG